ncbi:MAG: hypothetical protein AB1673_15800 [Actinomycetota bacterium]
MSTTTLARTAADAPRPPGPQPRTGPAPLVALGVATALWLWSLPRVDLGGLTDIGLVSALPLSFFAAVAVLTAGFFTELGRGEPRARLLWAYLVAAVVFLHGVVSVVEAVPRFPTSWIHAGFTDHIAEHNATLPLLDARFSWPGFFTAAALVERVAGLDSALWFVRWSPVVFNLVALAPVAILVRVADAEPRAHWTALWTFCVANWVGQDYFSPQALNFVLYAVILAVLLTWFRPTDTGRAPWLPGTGSLEVPVQPAGPGTRAALVVVVLAAFAASVVSHQLTPFALVAATAALVLGQRCVLRLLPVLFLAGALAWLSFAAEPYWRGHLADVTGGIGRITGAIQSGVGQRLAGNDGHVFVIRLRVVAALALWAVALVGAVRSYRRRRRVPWPHLLLMAAPFSLVALQSYGGEIMLRVYLLALPFAALLAALAFFPEKLAPGTRPGRGTMAVAAAASGAMALSFLVVRYGNERFESFTQDEVAAVEWVYENAPPRSRVVALNSSLPWRHRDIDTYSYIGSVPANHLDEAHEVLDYMTTDDGRPGYLLITRSQEAHGELIEGRPPGWTAEVEHLLASTGETVVAFRNRDAVVIHHPGGVSP